MIDATTPEPALNRAGRRAEARTGRTRKAGAVLATIPAAFGTTALLLGATAGTAGAATLTVNALGDAGDGTCDPTPGECTLRDAVDSAADGDTIVFESGLTGTIQLVSNPLAVDQAITIEGPGSASLSVSAAANRRAFYVNVTSGTEAVTISGLGVENGNPGTDGGGMFVQEAGILTLRDLDFTANTADGDGGALFTNSSTRLDLVIESSSFSGNSAASDGGAVSVYFADSVSITGTTFSDNTADGGGGAVYLWDADGDVLISGSDFTDNVADGDGGGAYLVYVGGTATISGSTFTTNSADSDGGGISFRYVFTETRIETSTFSGNSAGSDGGGAAVYFTDVLTVTGSTFTGNTAGSDGGGIHLYGYWEESDNGSTAATISASTFRGNTAGSDGGAMSVDESSAFTMTTTTVSGNSSGDGGGGLYLDDVRYGDATITNTTISGNSSVGDGGGIFVDTVDNGLGIFNSTISGNTAGGEGGGVFLSHVYYNEGSRDRTSSLDLVQTTVAGNVATTVGGVALEEFVPNSIGSADVDGHHSRGNLENAPAAAGERDPRDRSVRSAELTDPSTVFLHGTIISLNGAIDVGRTGTVQAVGSLFGTISGSTLVDQGGNLQGVDPLLGPLQDNGGPTFTHALLDGSPAINAGPNPLTPFPGSDDDQRGAGYPRVVGGQVDIGAFEVQPTNIEPNFTG